MPFLSSQTTSKVSPLAWIMGAVASLLVSCAEADYDTIPTYRAMGKLTVNGVAAKGAVVRLHPITPQKGAKHPLFPTGRVDCEGVFRLTTYEDDDGAPEGKYQVTIEWPDPDWRPEGSGPPPPPPDRLKGAFSDPRQTNWEVAIEKGANEIPPIELQGVEILEGSKLPMLSTSDEEEGSDS